VYAVVIYVPTTSAGRALESLRRKYDPQHVLIAPHITLVFPFQETIDRSALVSHLETIAQSSVPFDVRMQGLLCSADDHLFLVAGIGSAGLVDLHDRLYTGRLAAHLEQGYRFVPHITIGAFPGASESCAQAREQAERLDPVAAWTVDRFQAIQIKEDRSRLVWQREFLFSRSS
jgi:2'-5' RNA ligase